jgi:hypothetical protein
VASGVDMTRLSRLGLCAGQVLDLQAGDVRYRTAPLLFQVDAVLDDLARGYDDDWVWLEGHELHPTGRYPMTWLQLPVRVEAIAQCVSCRS